MLPLLEAETVARGWLSEDAFLAGYGAAQAVPGPLFTLPAYLGAVGEPQPNGIAGAGIALVAVSLPGLLLAVAGANAAVVGVLGAAFYDPVWTSAILSPLDAALVAGGLWR